MEKRLIVISHDALVYEDLDTLKQLPNFSKIWKQTSLVERVRSVYPTVTYPCHATMMTGLYPDGHGIINNEQLNMCERSSPWIHFYDALKAPTVFNMAKTNGLSTAAVFWPVTGHRPGAQCPVDYLVNEYWPQSEGETHYDCFVNSGSTPEVMEKCVAPNLPFITRYPRAHPHLDHFIHAAACDIIRAFKPNLLMLHPAIMDYYRHRSGLFTPLVTHGLHEVDMWFGLIMKACEDAGVLDETNFIITSDHGQLNSVRLAAPNVVFAEHGLIDVDNDKNITDYRAFCKSSGMSAHIFLKDPGDTKTYDETYALLKKMRDEEVYGISEVFTADEILAKERLSGGFSFVVETDGYSAFANDWSRPYLRPLSNEDYKYGRATHGYLPDKGPQPTFFAFGPDIKPGVSLERGDLVDQAPTFARLLGFDMDGVDGKVVEEILR